MKKLFAFLVFASVLFSAHELNSAEVVPGIDWLHFNDGYALANESGKIAIIDCYTDWCGWCKVMDKKTFADSAVIEKMNKNFVAIKFNPEKKDEQYIIGGDTISGPELLYALSNNKPSGYPTLFYYVPQTKRMFSQPGYQKVEDFQKAMDNLIDYQNKLKSK